MFREEQKIEEKLDDRRKTDSPTDNVLPPRPGRANLAPLRSAFCPRVHLGFRIPLDGLIGKTFPIAYSTWSLEQSGISYGTRRESPASLSKTATLIECLLALQGR